MIDGSSYTTLKRVPISLLKSLLAVTVIYSLSFLFLNVVIRNYLLLEFDANIVVLNIVLLVTFASYASLFFISWSTTDYKIADGKLEYTSGLFRKIKKEMDILSSVTYQQSLIQRIINAGNLYYANENTGESFLIIDVSNPRQVIEILHKNLHNTNFDTEQVVQSVENAENTENTGEQVPADIKDEVMETQPTEQIEATIDPSERTSDSVQEDIKEVTTDIDELNEMVISEDEGDERENIETFSYEQLSQEIIQTNQKTILTERHIEIEIETNTTFKIPEFIAEEETAGEFELNGKESNE